MNLLKLLESNIFVLRQFVLKYRTVQAMREKLREKANETVFLSGFKKKTIECQTTVSCLVYLRDAASLLKEQI